MWILPTLSPMTWRAVHGQSRYQTAPKDLLHLILTGGGWICSAVMQHCGFGKIELVSLDLPSLPYQVSPINSLHLFREKYVCGSYWRMCRYWRNYYLPVLMTGGLSLPVSLNLFNNSCLISTSCDDKSLQLTAFIIERYCWDTSCETVL